MIDHVRTTWISNDLTRDTQVRSTKWIHTSKTQSLCNKRMIQETIWDQFFLHYHCDPPKDIKMQDDKAWHSVLSMGMSDVISNNWILRCTAEKERMYLFGQIHANPISSWGEKPPWTKRHNIIAHHICITGETATMTGPQTAWLWILNISKLYLVSIQSF